MSWIRISLFVLIVQGFGMAAAADAEAPLVVTSNSILRDAVQQIGGDDVRVVSLLPAGMSPYDYEPSASDIQLFSVAQLVMVNGVNQEPWLAGLVEASGYSREIIVAAEGLVLLDSEGRLHDPEAEELNYEPAFSSAVIDPHFWHNPGSMIHLAKQISYSLPDLLPELGAEIEARTQAYVSRLEELQGYAEAQFGALPPHRRQLVTSLGSLGYLGQAYGLTITTIPDFEPGRTPQPPQLARMVEIIAQAGAPAVFLRAGTSSHALRQISAETGVRIVTTLFTDSLQEGETYLERFRQNVDAIVGALSVD